MRATERVYFVLEIWDPPASAAVKLIMDYYTVYYFTLQKESALWKCAFVSYL